MKIRDVYSSSFVDVVLVITIGELSAEKQEIDDDLKVGYIDLLPGILVEITG